MRRHWRFHESLGWDFVFTIRYLFEEKKNYGRDGKGGQWKDTIQITYTL